MITESPATKTRSPIERASSKDAARTVLVARCDGRLGNQLFLYSHLITCALETGCKILHPTFRKYGRHFEGSHRDPLCRFPLVQPTLSLALRPLLGSGSGRRMFELVTLNMAHRVPFFRNGVKTVKRNDANHQMDSPVFLRQTAGARVVLMDEWTWRYTSCIAKYYDTIRTHFAPVARHRRAVDAIEATARESCDVLIGVHIRHGDFRDWFDGRFFHPVERFAAVMRHVDSLLPGVRVGFLICSDEPQDPAAFKDLQVHFSSGDMVQDLYSLARCDYLIGTFVSSFSAWASFYGETPMWTLKDDTPPPNLDEFKVFSLTDDP